MPLKAVVDGETVIGPDLSRGEWTQLLIRHKKGLPVTMACCGAPGHMRVSKKGTQHFYHASGTGCRYEEESKEHLEIKYRIYRTCKMENWETYVEFPAPDRSWISDVYATRDNRKVVFEIQISAISLSELGDRDRKYRDEGIESYWLLDDFLGRSGDFEAWDNSYLYGEDDQREEAVPYTDHSLFKAGPENHIFIGKGILSAGLDARKQTLFTANNPEIPLEDWTREVLKGNYRHYLEETAAVLDRKRRLKDLAAPALIRLREFYHNIIRHGTCQEKAGHYYRVFLNDKTLMNDKSLQKKFDELYSEIDWLEKEYRLVLSESYGLFVWKKMPKHDTLRPFFRFESKQKVEKLQECVQKFSQWEESFNDALSSLEREICLKQKRYDDRD